MQIFMSDKNHKQCAKNLDDRRLIKMPVEAAQIASTALWMNNCDIAETMYSQGKIYLPTHEYHPVTAWCYQNYNHYINTVIHGLELCQEYSIRFNYKVHTTEEKLFKLLDIGPEYWNNVTEAYPMPNATTHHKHIDNIYLAYKQELCYKWNIIDKQEPKWTNRSEPKFRKDFYYE